MAWSGAAPFAGDERTFFSLPLYAGGEDRDQGSGWRPETSRCGNMLFWGYAHMASIGDLPAVFSAPSKLVYLSYVILTGLKVLAAPPLWLFVIISAVYWAFDVVHNDYLRIVLNGFGEKKKTETMRPR
jgi:hypothetical protein